MILSQSVSTVLDWQTVNSVPHSRDSISQETKSERQEGLFTHLVNVQGMTQLKGSQGGS